MTTVIACRSLGRMVADTRVSHGETKFKSSKKVQRVGAFLVGVAGSYSRALAYLKVFANEARDLDGKTAPKLPPAEAASDGEGYMELMVMSHHGLWIYGDDGTPIEVEEDFYVTGSGAAWAIACLRTQERLLVPCDLGMAMEVACEFDNDSGLPMIELKLKGLDSDDAGGNAAEGGSGGAQPGVRRTRQRRGAG